MYFILSSVFYVIVAVCQLLIKDFLILIANIPSPLTCCQLALGGLFFSLAAISLPVNRVKRLVAQAYMDTTLTNCRSLNQLTVAPVNANYT